MRRSARSRETFVNTKRNHAFFSLFFTFGLLADLICVMTLPVLFQSRFGTWVGLRLVPFRHAARPSGATNSRTEALDARLPARERRPRWRTASRLTPTRSSSFDVRPRAPPVPDRAPRIWHPSGHVSSASPPGRRKTASSSRRSPGRSPAGLLPPRGLPLPRDRARASRPRSPPFLRARSAHDTRLTRRPRSTALHRETVELKKQIPTTIRLYNATTAELAFKVKTTAPKKYCVKPNTGFVAPGATQIVHVIMQAQREWPADVAGCKDKFLVQSVASGGVTDFAELFAKGKEGIKESKLRVAYTQPPPPPSPVPEGEEDTRTEDTAATAASRMPSDVAGLQRELERYRIKNESLSADLNASLRTKDGAARGFSLLHVLITGASRLVPVPHPSRTFLFPRRDGFFFGKNRARSPRVPFPLQPSSRSSSGGTCERARA